jgi:hypothetical protein
LSSTMLHGPIPCPDPPISATPSGPTEEAKRPSAQENRSARRAYSEKLKANQVECLILDSRAELTPAQMVERKLVSLLKGRLLPVSHVRMTNLLGNRRGPCP